MTWSLLKDLHGLIAQTKNIVDFRFKSFMEIVCH